MWFHSFKFWLNEILFLLFKSHLMIGKTWSGVASLWETCRFPGGPSRTTPLSWLCGLSSLSVTKTLRASHGSKSSISINPFECLRRPMVQVPLMYFFANVYKQSSFNRYTSSLLKSFLEMTNCCSFFFFFYWNRNLSYNPIQTIQANQFDNLVKLKSL